jgi:hypothetical protein
MYGITIKVGCKLKKRIICIITALVLSTSFSFTVLAESKNNIIVAKTNNIQVSDTEKEQLMSGKLSVDDFYKNHSELKKLRDQEKNQPEYTLDKFIKDYPQQKNTTESIFSTMSGDPYYDFRFTDKIDDDFDTDPIPSYGGNQGWNNNFINNTGCGAVAACNTMAYNARYYGKSNLYPYAWTQAGFTKFQSDMFFKFLAGPTVTTEMMANAINRYTKSKGYNYTSSMASCWSATSDSFAELLNFIQDSIDTNNPVTLLLGPNYTGGEFAGYEPNFVNHWVTITGYNYIYSNFDVTVSSWGEKYTLDLHKLVHSRVFVDASIHWYDSSK